MRAVVQQGFGSPDVLQLAELERPVIADDQVLVRVHAASVNAADCHLLRVPRVVRRVMGRGRVDAPAIGFDLAGRIEAVGAGVTRFALGDEVFGSAPGAFAEYVATTPDRLAPRPRALSFAQAAAAPVAGVSALQGLRDAARVVPGQRVLIFGAGGGVGTFAVQIARGLGAHVTAATRPRNLDVVRAVHPDELIDYTKDDVTLRERQFDVFFDLAATRPLRDCRRSVAPGGVVVLAGAAKGGVGTIVSRLAAARILSRLRGPRVVSFMARMSHDDLVALAALIEAGVVSPVIDREFALGDAREAVRYVASGQARAKVVIHIT